MVMTSADADAAGYPAVTSDDTSESVVICD